MFAHCGNVVIEVRRRDNVLPPLSHGVLILTTLIYFYIIHANQRGMLNLKSSSMPYTQSHFKSE